ncbi:OmpA family protein [Flagellimonas sp. HMM57]|uniref:OmpA family protein n=1 Tax=unclassified Flagellimonas TaxID=2644544 RepID=UPI001F0AA9B5|nr:MULTISPECIES: OmpA family protein [unclassified Flagellimonas]UII77611.1 OmpA family protein [Flagellimonas sp. HMM57]
MQNAPFKTDFSYEALFRWSIMKYLISTLSLLLVTGLQAQSISFLQFDDEEASNDAIVESSRTKLIQQLDNVEDKKLARFIRKKGASERLIKKADALFEKMWYAEAAKIYDMVLEKSNEVHTFKLLSKAGDSHYYSGNLEKSYKWYHELYESYNDRITEETFFKYAHTLKGTGRYRRAAKLTKEFNEKREMTEKEVEKEIKALNGRALVDIKNMSINSEYSDFSPMFYNGNEVVFTSAKDSAFLTTRNYKWNNQPFLDLYTAKKNETDGDLTNAKKFSKNINTKYHEASISFSPDQKTIYFTRNNYGKKLKRGKNGINHLKIYQSNFVNDEWTKAKSVSFNSENYSNGHPAISSDGKRMYFASDRPGGYGLTDVYVVDILEDGTFSEPKNLGRNINTDKKEMFPFITENALYFSSDRVMGVGGLDVYKADYANGVFGTATNLGMPINSTRDDFSYIINEETQEGYFASNREGGKGDDDIYSFKNIVNLNAISGIVEDLETGEVLSEATVTLIDKDNAWVAETTTALDGTFIFENLDPLSKYTINTVKKEYEEQSTSVSTRDNESVTVAQSLKPLEILIAEENGVLVEEKGELKFETEAIYFDFDRFAIKKQAATELDKLVGVMKENPSMVIKIESHTDARGNRSYNKYLSDKRAKATKAYIVSQGIDASRIESAIGYGEEKLLNGCEDGTPCAASEHRQNRRSEFIIVEM